MDNRRHLKCLLAEILERTISTPPNTEESERKKKERNIHIIIEPPLPCYVFLWLAIINLLRLSCRFPFRLTFIVMVVHLQTFDLRNENRKYGSHPFWCEKMLRKFYVFPFLYISFSFSRLFYVYSECGLCVHVDSDARKKIMLVDVRESFVRFEIAI